MIFSTGYSDRFGRLYIEDAYRYILYMIFSAGYSERFGRLNLGKPF